MLQVEQNMTSLIREVLVAYEDSISATGALIDSTYGILEDSNKELEKFNNQVRETLARKASLRKKDFDNFVAEIELRRRQRHQEIKAKLTEYVHLHGQAASQLRGLVDDPQSRKIVVLRVVLDEIKTQDDTAQKNLARLLEDFQNEQDEIIAEVHRLLNDSVTIKTKDFKAAIGKFAMKEVVTVP